MPASEPRFTKIYPFVTGAVATDPTQPQLPANPQRIAIFIQDTGGVAGLARFGGPTQGGGADIAFAIGQDRKWDQADTCPQEGVWLSSSAATTWCVMETVRGRGPNG